MRTTALILFFLAFAACRKAPHANTYAPTKGGQATAHFVLVIGQSNADGRCTAARLVNPAWAYKGISALPLVARTTQEPYGYDATDLSVYFKTPFASDDQSLDNGSWQPYAIGVNNAHTGATTTDQIGPEFSAAITLRDAIGAPINIIKCAYSSTGLCPWINETTPPGTWNPTATYAGNRYTAIEYFVRRGVEDFRDANPGVACKLAGVIWWGGESDANANVTTAQYTTQFNSLLNYMRPELAAIFDNDSTEPPQWNLVSLSFRRNTKEALINTALSNIAAADPDIHYVDSWPYPRCQNLTTAQASPIAKGLPNSAGGNDNQHASHISQLAVGELCAQNVIAAGLVIP